MCATSACVGPWRWRGCPTALKASPFHNRPPAHFAHQPFGQIPWLTDGDITIFESGAILLHLGEKSDKLMPVRPAWPQRGEGMAVRRTGLGRGGKPAVVILHVLGHRRRRVDVAVLRGFLEARLERMEQVLTARESLVGTFSVADILMADVLRLVHRFDGLASYPACRDYVARATAPRLCQGLRRPNGPFRCGGLGGRLACACGRNLTRFLLLLSSSD